MIRKAIAYGAMPLVLVLVLVVLTWMLPTSAPTATPAQPTPSATPSYPPCVTEEGAGQALCWWDAQTQGNGEGTSVVSGDCAPSVVGMDSVNTCVVVHGMDSYTYEYQGATVTVPNGADLIGECVIDKADMPIRECLSGMVQ